jgi:hypothetical protein
VQGKRWQRGDDQFALLRPGLGQKRCVGNVAKRRAYLERIEAPLFSQPQSSRFTHEECNTHGVFENPDLLADCRVRHVKFARSERDAAEPGSHLETSERG